MPTEDRTLAAGRMTNSAPFGKLPCAVQLIVVRPKGYISALMEIKTCRVLTRRQPITRLPPSPAIGMYPPCYGTSTPEAANNSAPQAGPLPCGLDVCAWRECQAMGCPRVSLRL